MTYGKLDFLARDVLRNFKEYSYNIKKSSLSDSIYLYITDGKIVKSLRISDHKNVYGVFCNTEIVSDKIKQDCVRRTIVNLCKSLRRKKMNNYFKEIASKTA